MQTLGEYVENIVEPPEMIVVSVCDEYLLDLYMAEVIHELVKVLEKLLIVLWVVPTLDHDSFHPRPHDETVRSTQCELARVLPRNVVNELP